MNHTLENEVLTIFLEGELNSSTSEGAEKEIEAIVSKNGFKSIVLDTEKLKYISSAGLRIVVKLKQKYSDIKIVNVNDVVFDIFDMVGFNNLMTIERIHK